MRKLVTTTHLEMTSRSELARTAGVATSLQLVRAELPSAELSRFLYTTVGARWTWYVRLPWSYDRWLAWVDRPELETWIGYVCGTPAGYFELEQQPEGNVEIAYFGLLPAFLGKGFGGPLLTAAVERAWDLGAKRVWVHTCDLDHPGALPNYCARGFRIFKVTTDEEELPDAPLEPWPGAWRR